MDQPYEVKEDGTIVTSSAELSNNFILSADRLTFSTNVEQPQGMNADLIERRLQRIEEALGVAAICVR